MTRAAIYVRISQDREGGGLGVQRQEKDCRALAERLGYGEPELYCDNDVSAYSGKPRPEYERLLRDVKSGHVTAVICWHTDRLHRSTRELESYIDVASAIPTHSVKAGLLDLSSASGRAVAITLGAWAQYESQHKSERQKRKADELASKGLPLGGGRPFGYEPDGLTIRETEAQELRTMVSRVLAGDSLGAIMRDLNERGVLTTRGKTWGYTSMRSLLLRERNCGRMVHRGQVIGMAAWDPIITETKHDAVAALLADPARRTTSNPARKHLLSGLAKCSCGLGMKPGWVKGANGTKHWIYTCRTRSSGHAHRSMARVDEYVTERVLDFLSVVSVQGGTDNTAALETERSAIKARLDETAVMYASGAINAAQLTAITSTLSVREEAITEALNAFNRGTALEGVVGISRDEWEALSLDRKRTIIDAVLTIEVRPLRGSRELGARAVYRTGGRFGFRVPRDVEQRIVAATS